MPLKQVISRMYGLFPKILDAIDLLQRAYIYSNPKFLDDVDAAAREIHLAEKALTEEIVEASKEDRSGARYISIPGHIERIGDYIENMSRAIRLKNTEKILFSDKATDEINFLFEKIKDILNNTADMLLARNTLIAGYIREADLAIARNANEFSTLHEERLIEGLCMPKASSIYLDLLDAFKAISWHSKEIAQRLVE